MKLELSNLSDLEVLTLTLIGEARGEPIEGKVAVACVIRNRATAWKKSISEICLQPKQFSCWNEDDPNRLLLDELAQRFIYGNKLEIPSYIECQCVARGVIRNEILDNTHGALNYLTSDLFASDHRPQWAQHVSFAITKGRQTFFRV